MPIYTKFSDRFHRTQGSTPTPANPANPAKVSPIGYANTPNRVSALAALAALARLAEGRPHCCTSDERQTVIGPRRLSGRLAYLQPAGEPPYDRPYDRRRGRIIRYGGSFLHFCMICGAWGAYGYGITDVQTGRWYCHEHRQHEGKR